VPRLSGRQKIAAAVLAVLAACFLTLDLGGGSLASTHGGVRGALGSLYRGTDTVLGPVRRFLQALPSAASDRARLERLQHDNAVLRGQVRADRLDRKTAARLAQLRLTAHQLGTSVLPTRVIAIGPGGGFDWTVTISAGRADGVRSGQTVTDGAGLVGRVLHADGSTSVVLLAADPGSGVGARDVRSGQLGVVTGRGAKGFVFVPLNPQASIRTGDLLLTGPSRSSSYIPNLALGTVTAVDRSGGTVRATVRAAVSPTALDLVGVLRASPATQALPGGGR
jgi:rod shape-determining protein MreC